MDINEFNNKYNEDISNNKTSYKFKDLGDEGLKIFCTFNLEILERLNLSYNTISNIDCFKKMKLPKLTILDLSHNKIKNIQVFAKVNYPLEQLDLSYNAINNIDIFKKETTLPNLKSLLLSNNDINFEDKAIKIIMETFNEKINKNEEKSMEGKNDENYSNVLRRLKALNSRINADIGIYDKNAISRIKTLRDSDVINNEELKMIIDGISLLSSIRQEDNNNID
jgi:Leucine-rich repeat (LRR) protein